MGGKWLPGKYKNYKKKQCPLCPYYGSAKYVVRGHYEAKHMGQRNWPCDQCDFAAQNAQYLKIHKRTVHDRIYASQEQLQALSTST